MNNMVNPGLPPIERVVRDWHYIQSSQPAVAEMSIPTRVASTEPTRATSHHLGDFHQGKFSDITVKCREREWKLHRVILASQSKFFDVCCGGEFKESISGVIDLSDDDPNALEMLFEYLYTGAITKIPINPDDEGPPPGFLVLLLNLYQVADKYDQTELAQDVLRCLQTPRHTFAVDGRRTQTMVNEHPDQLIQAIFWLWNTSNHGMDDQTRLTLQHCFLKFLVAQSAGLCTRIIDLPCRCCREYGQCEELSDQVKAIARRKMEDLTSIFQNNPLLGVALVGSLQSELHDRDEVIEYQIKEQDQLKVTISDLQQDKIVCRFDAESWRKKTESAHDRILELISSSNEKVQVIDELTNRVEYLSLENSRLRAEQSQPKKPSGAARRRAQKLRKGVAAIDSSFYGVGSR